MSATPLRTALTILPYLLLTGTIGCGAAETAESPGERNVKAPHVAFLEEFERIGRVVPEQSEQEPLARLSGMDVRSDGAFMIGDVSVSQVKLYDGEGRVLARIGRQGDGPGEFRSPRFPRFGPDGRIYVADAQTPRIQIFDGEGGYLSGVPLEVPRIQGFRVLGDGTFLILAAVERSGNVLLHMDSTGSVLGESLPIAGVLPEGESPHQGWTSLRSFSLAMTGDTAFVSSSLSNHLWQIDIASGATTTTVLDFEGYLVPRIPRDPTPANARELFEWAGSVHMTSTLSAGEGEVHLPFVQGVLNYGDPMVLLSRTRAGEWMAISGAPPVVFAYGDSLITIEEPDADYLTLGVYRRR